ncbi:cytochrome o ubiquinol oxidase subunit III [Candidatus Profftia tarda]|uniref:Cytochrome bo(3) ubiquinol oxidase subunit 3 n=1 Tax=Candidatus Profftia tarda TaxID=1177216 RepID=A0A8E4F0J4_9ENTR|nr:cytochrome o ubiquinol oxidase subunit III [Candidatus Profftia tarda]CAD6512388.1 Cytochrome bo(3) ubiquinol oxidase subunit 3 [Candidatus Profftia tarda]
MISDTLQIQKRDTKRYAGDTKIFGFRIYLMSDCILFAALFATYAVLVNNIADGPSGREIFKLPFVLTETLLLLLSSMTCGFSILAIQKNKSYNIITWLGMTFLLGASFIAMESYEFHNLFSEGFGPDKSAFLSAFFALAGTHGIHVTSGLLWIIVMMIQISKTGLISANITRLVCLSLFWHLLDIVWVCLFTFVYLVGLI